MKSFLEYLLEGKNKIQKVLINFEDALQFFNDTNALNNTGLTIDNIKELYDIAKEHSYSAPVVANYKDKLGQFVLRRWVLNELDQKQLNMNKSLFKGFHDTNLKDNQNQQEGQSAGEHAEPGVAYIFNNINDNVKIESENIDEAVIDNNIRSVLFKNGLDEEWIQSSYASALKIISQGYTNKTYIAAHVNGDDFSEIPENIRNVADIFYGKTKFAQVFKLSKKDLKLFNDLYTGQKDNWNKADIVLVNKLTHVYDQILAANIVDSTSLNGILNALIENNDIIPISLKKIIPDAKVNQIKFEKEGNFTNSDQAVTDIAQITDVSFQWPVKALNANSQDCSCYLITNNGIKIQFRKASGNGNNLSVELMLKGARGGKPITQVKNDLKIMSVDNKYYANFTSEEDFYRQLKEVLQFDPGKISNKAKNNINDWYNRVCFKGLVGLLQKYYEVYTGKTLKDFFQYLHSFASGSNSKSIFYILTMK